MGAPAASRTVHIGQAYGFEFRNGKLAVHRGQAKQVAKIFQSYADGQSMGQIAADLNRRGAKAPGGGSMWRSDNVYRVTRREAYVEWAIIPQELFDAVTARRGRARSRLER